MVSSEFKKWLRGKGIEFSTYSLMNDSAKQEVNAAYMKEKVQLNKRYNIKELEAHYPSVCIEMTDLKTKKGKILSGVLVNIFPNALKTEERYGELMQIGNITNYIVGWV